MFLFSLAVPVKLDVGFILGASSSNADQNFETMKKIIKEMLKAYTVSLEYTRVGLVLYGTTANVVSYLKDSTDLDTILDVLNGLEYLGDGTDLKNALLKSNSELFVPANGARFGIEKVLVLLTDKKSDVDPVSTAKSIVRDGVNVVCIGVGSEVDKNEIDQINDGRLSNSVVDSVIDNGLLEQLSEVLNKVIKPGMNYLMSQLVVCDMLFSIVDDLSFSVISYNV